MINYDKLKEEHALVSEQLSHAAVLTNREKYQHLTRRFSFLEKIMAMLKLRDELFAQKAHLKEILTVPKEEEEVKHMAREELAAVENKISALQEGIEERLFEEDEPEGDVLVEIRAAAGGEESALFAATLLKMYSKYIERKGWNFELLSSHATDIKGYKEVIFSVQGKGAYTNLKFESGVHRVQRVPATEASGRIHTSTVTVAVLIEPQEVELKLGPEDLRIDTYRAGGAGGQHVNRTDSAVRMTHLPTGIVVCCQDERSQLKNRTKALKIMKIRIMDKMEREQTAKITSARRVQVGTGERSEKIRTYNFPERRITDHRINFTTYRLEEVLEGDLAELFKALTHEERKKLYELKGLV